jgi:hypothetical protein
LEGVDSAPVTILFRSALTNAMKGAFAGVFEEATPSFEPACRVAREPIAAE